jgi:hypothetical protein
MRIELADRAGEVEWDVAGLASRTFVALCACGSEGEGAEWDVC